MFIHNPTNADYLISDVRLRLGDLEGETYSDSYVRAAIISAVRFLQRRWNSRYLLYRNGMKVDPLPDGVITQNQKENGISGNVVVPHYYIYAKVLNGYAFIPDNLNEGDVFRNPYEKFLDPANHLDPDYKVFSQDDDYAIVIQATIIMRVSQLTSSSSTFQNWKGGEFSFSNVSSYNAMSKLLENENDELERFFRRRLASPLRSGYRNQYYGNNILIG